MIEPNFRPEFSVGSVFNHAFRIFGSNLGAFFALAAIGLAPFVVMLYGYSQIIPALDAVKQGGAPPVIPTWISLLNWATGGLSMVSFGAMIHATVAHLEGRPIDIGESLGVGVRRFFPLLGVYIVFAICVGVGLVFLIIPGFLLMICWYMAFPVAIAERRGVFGSLGRAWELSKGHRGTLFGIGFLYALLGTFGYILIAMGACVVGFASGGGSESSAPSAMALFAVMAPLGTLTYVAGAAIYAILCAVAYHGLRTEKDGTSPERLANVFG